MGKEPLSSWWFKLGWFARPLALLLIVASPLIMLVLVVKFVIDEWPDFIEFNRTSWKIVTSGVTAFRNPQQSHNPGYWDDMDWEQD